jgi:Ca-activated chloride channel family protein
MNAPTLEIAKLPGAALVSVDGRTYPLESVRVTARAEGGVASTRLIQIFRNPHDEPFEVIYTLPLPADGAVLGYTIRMGERVIRGEVEPREKAVKQYREALYQGQTAALLEQDRADTFQQRLGNLLPHTKAEVEIEVLQPLAFLNGNEVTVPRWEYRFPTVVGVRYEGAPGRVPDAERLDVDRDGDGAIPTRVEFELEVAERDKSALKIDSPSHDLDSSTSGAVTTVRLANVARLDRDIVVNWDACSGEVGVRLATGSGLGGDAGRYGLLSIVPPAVPDTTLHRDLTLLIDASGSMHGEPLETAKEVSIELLKSLSEGDRFEVLEFANQPRRHTHGMVEASPEAIEKMVSTVQQIQSAGGTEMVAAIQEALLPIRKNSQRQVVLLSDGYIGFESEAIEKVVSGLPEGARLHCVGIGSAPNRSLTRFLARAGRGVEVIAADRKSGGKAAGRLRAATARPVLTEIAVTGSAVRGVAPSRPRDVFAGQAVVITVELEPAGGSLEIRGWLAGEGKPWIRQLAVPAAGSSTESKDVSGKHLITETPLPLGALLGREAIADVELSIGSVDDEYLWKQIEQLGMRHRIASSRTSLIAISDEPTVDPQAPRRRERLAVEVPYEVSAEGTGLLGMQVAGAITGMHAPGEYHAMTEIAGTPTKDKIWGGPRSLARLGRFRTLTGGPLPLRIEKAAVLKIEDGVVVVEFESPFKEFLLPSGPVEVLIDGVHFGVGSVVKEKSTRKSRWFRGQIIRLAIKLDDDQEWPDKGDVELQWVDSGRRLAGRTVSLPFKLQSGR